MRRRTFLVLLLLLTLAPSLRADDHPNTARGFAADKAFQVGDIDNVNLFNGNLTLTLPIGGSYPAGGGFSYGLTLVYNSNLWDFQERLDDSTGTTYQQGLPQRTQNAGLGWLLTLGRLLAPFTPGNDTERWVYQGSDGSEHVFYPTLHAGDADEPGDTSMFQSVSYTRDGSYLRMKVVTGGVREIEFANGQVHRFGIVPQLTEIRDRFNNRLNVFYGEFHPQTGEPVWRLTDSQNRTHYIVLQTLTQDHQPVEVVKRVEQAAFGGATAPYSFSYASVTIPRACPHNDPSLGSSVQVPLLTSVSLPDGSSYQISVSDYVTALGPDDPCRSSGAIRGLTLPTLGRLEYTYQNYSFPAVNKLHRQFAAGVAERRTRNASGGVPGVTTYATSFTGTGTSQELRNTVTDPLLHSTERWFLALPGSHEYSLPFTHLAGDGAGRFLSSRTYNAAGLLLRTTYVLYESDQRPSFPQDQQEGMNVNRREKSSRTVYADDGGRFADLNRADFDGLGHYRTETTGGNFNAGDVRTATAAYNPARGTYFIDPATNQPGAGHTFTMWPAASPWVLETFESRREDEGTGTAFSKFCFDANTGFLLRRRTLKNSGTAESANDLLTVFTPDGAGNLQTEQSFGGDTQSLATGNTCAMALPAPKYRIDHTYQFGARATSQYSGASFLSLDQTIDGPTGLPSQSRDASGIATDFEYDLQGRLTWVKPAAGNNDGWTEYVYTRAFSAAALANVLVRRRNNGSKTAAVQAQSQIFFDALGRVWQEKQLLPSGVFNVRETLYNGAGHKSSVSEVVTGTPVSKTQFLNYDPFGRAVTIRPPDGAGHDVTFNYLGVRVVERTVKIATATNGAESFSTTTETYDRQGRLSSVTEPSGNADAPVTTTYSYDVGNRLRQVQTASGGVTQNRFFTYDNRGFLASETHPEKGASGNGNVTYSSYDARGHAGRKIDGESDLTFAYDSAERLTLVRETGGAQRTLKSFTYAGANGNYVDPITGASCFDFRKGKLTQQSRFNYVTVHDGPFAVELREALTYCGREGRLSRRSLENWVNGGLNESFFLPNVTYNALGDVTSLDYPRCTHAACTSVPGGPSPRTVTSSYTNGFLTAVGVPGNAGSYAGSLTYHPNRMVNQVVHSNTLTDTYANDPNAMRRPSSITVTTTAGPLLWSTGTYAYDGAGNVKAIGTHIFNYDKVSRVKTGSLYLEPTSSVNLRTQTYSYDAFGNIQSIGGSSARNTPTSSSTNRLTGGGYDAAGNLTSWNFNTYQYDPFNLMWSYRTPSDEWIYLYTVDDERAWTFKVGGASLWTLRGTDGKVLREYSAGASWAVDSDYIHRDGSLLAAETPQGTRHFHLDHLGTPRLVTASGASSGGDFYTLTPCRVIDTRDQSAPISAGTTRTVQMAGACGIPAGASAVSVNLTAVDSTADGDMTAYPANEARPTASAISYRAGLARANNAVLKLGNGTLAFFANQVSGSVHLIVDVNGYFMEEGAGSVVAYHVYYPFGEEVTAFNQDTLRAKFTGHERDLGNLSGAGDDLDYMHARHCSPLTGRFLSVDPILAKKPATKKPQLWNRYAYVGGNPLKYFDPTGQILQLTGDVNKALIDLRNTVPPEDRIFIRTKRTKTGEVVLDQRLLKSRARSSESANFQRIAGIADSPKIVQLNTSSPSFTLEFKGETKLIHFGDVEDLGGITLPQGQNSTAPNVTQIFVDPSLGALATARATAEELTHARLFLQGKAFRHETIPGGSTRDPRGEVNRLTAAAAAEAEANYDPFYPLN